MPACPRREIVIPGEVGFYHCVSRCVRRAWLCGVDPLDQRSYEHRKVWVEERLRHLAAAYAIEVCAFAVMSNHLHVLVRTRPDWAAGWTDEEVVKRWRMLCPIQTASDDPPCLPGPERIALWRTRLSSLSWFMGKLAESIARRANKEDGVKGRFWEGRFYCQAVLDETAVLACATYIDLNPVRAGVAETPETSQHTSVYERIAARQAATVRAGSKSAQRADWLCPISLTSSEGCSRRGFLPLTLDEYLKLLDWSGRQVRSDKAGSIPHDLAPILDRLSIRAEHWLSVAGHFTAHFRHVAGRPQSIRKWALQRGRRWYQGLGSSRLVFADPVDAP